MTFNLLAQSALTEAKHSPFRFFGISISVIFAVYIFLNEFIRKAARIPGLTGPRGLPLIGNLLQIRENAAEKYRQWARSHGSVYQIQLGNIPIVVVNSAGAAKSLFGQNAQAMSSRPEFYTFHKVIMTTVEVELVL